jgi:hypothetical protein
MSGESDLPVRFGFRSGSGGAHQARSMMLNEITELFRAVPREADAEKYREAVVDRNALSKKTLSNRMLTYGHLENLFGLDPSLALFRAFRKLWDFDERPQPLLALQYAFTRDALLRASAPAVLSKKAGDAMTTAEMTAFLSHATEGRFSPASLKSFAQNANTSWTRAGFLRGGRTKVRAHPWADAFNAAFAAFTAWLTGIRGEGLFENRWTALLDSDADGVLRLIEAASARGIVRLLRVGPVMELRFPGWLSEEEEAEIRGQA